MDERMMSHHCLSVGIVLAEVIVGQDVLKEVDLWIGRLFLANRADDENCNDSHDDAE